MSERDTATGCLVWTGCRDKNGYGRVIVYEDGVKKSRLAHRAAWQAARGPVPEGMPLDHLCRNRGCIELEHLEPVTQKVNLERAMPYREVQLKDVCPLGHPYSGDNVQINVKKNGKISRACKTCKADRQRAARKQARDVRVSASE